MSQSVKGKTAIVTGAGSGINLAFASSLLAKGCNVVLADLALRPEAQKVLQEHQKDTKLGFHGIAVFQETDVRDWLQLERMFTTAQQHFGRIDIVCPGAGVYEPPFSNFWHPPGTSASRDSLDGGRYALFDINLIHPIRSSQLAISHFLGTKDRGNKTIILISSTSAQDTSIATPLYDASKHAISGFVRSLSNLSSANIRIAAVAPGIIKTPLYTDNPEKMAMVDGLQDVWVEPEEVAEVMVALIERDRMSETIGEYPKNGDIQIKSGTILEVTKGRARPVHPYHDPGPSGPGALASNMAAAENAVMEMLKPGWGAPETSNAK
ncbi:3-hydroxybutyrate dehydrogenase [Fusarium mundagurra]|uniref:3-hydroxybutyrate dehydrogenase n=1 Tax=Fusarium mundagurra TaxID=1567541 RepID=A0A8H5Y1Y7_9HYPO|nr:3-hydroxybutyrate dehydrogenase [Fusarium mundagurra]